jgi:hypothetical protein
MEVPEWRTQEQSYELQKARDILRNLNATDEEREPSPTRVLKGVSDHHAEPAKSNRIKASHRSRTAGI